MSRIKKKDDLKLIKAKQKNKKKKIKPNKSKYLFSL